jgi:hypothetical protein
MINEFKDDDMFDNEEEIFKGLEDDMFDEFEEEATLVEFLEQYDIDDLIKIAERLNIDVDIFDFSDDDIIELILQEDEELIKQTCLNLFNDSFDMFSDDYEVNNRWRYSNYESKDINDWDVDDHIAAAWDHAMEK